jgi:hypothetical protein
MIFPESQHGNLTQPRSTGALLPHETKAHNGDQQLKVSISC